MTEYFFTITPEELIERVGSAWRVDKRQTKWVSLRYCPVCNGGCRRDRGTFAINRKIGFYTCLRGSCGAKGGFWNLIELAGFNPKDFLDREKMNRVNNTFSARSKQNGAYVYRREQNAF